MRDFEYGEFYTMIKKSAFRGALFCALLASTGCFRNDIRTETFDIDQLRSQAAVQLLAQALQPIPGILELRPDLETRQLTVVFNGREAYLKNIEYAIVQAGFGLPNWPAAAENKIRAAEPAPK